MKEENEDMGGTFGIAVAFTILGLAIVMHISVAKDLAPFYITVDEPDCQQRHHNLVGVCFVETSFSKGLQFFLFPITFIIAFA